MALLARLCPYLLLAAATMVGGECGELEGRGEHGTGEVREVGWVGSASLLPLSFRPSRPPTLQNKDAASLILLPWRLLASYLVPLHDTARGPAEIPL